MKVALWISQIFLGLLFSVAGVMKLALPSQQLHQMIPWTISVPPRLVSFTAFVDLAGGLGMLLPWALRVGPKLTTLAAAGLVVLMVLASLFHASRGEYPNLPVNLVLGAMACFVAWGRWKLRPVGREQP